MKTGRLTLKPWPIVNEVLYDKDSKRATGVRVLDALSMQSTDYKAKVVFLCASTLNSTWILLRSATDIWPGGLGSSSGELGHNLMDHHFRVGAEGRIEGLRRQGPVRPQAELGLHPALSQSLRREARLSARLRLRRLGRIARVGRAPSRSWESAAGSRMQPPSQARGRSAAAPSARCCPTTRTS